MGSDQGTIKVNTLAQGDTHIGGNLVLGSDDTDFTITRPANSVTTSDFKAPSTSLIGTEAAQEGGDILVTAGTGFSGGDVYVDGGESTGSVLGVSVGDGTVHIGTSTSSAVEIGRTDGTITMEGTVVLGGSQVSVSSPSGSDWSLSIESMETSGADVDGGSITITAQDGDLAGTGGSVNIASGSSLSGVAGDVNLTGDTVSVEAPTSVELLTPLVAVGDGTSATAIQIRDNTDNGSTLAALGLDLSITGQQAVTTGGRLVMTGGTALSGTGGDIEIEGGVGGGGTRGSIYIGVDSGSVAMGNSDSASETEVRGNMRLPSDDGGILYVATIVSNSQADSDTSLDLDSDVSVYVGKSAGTVTLGSLSGSVEVAASELTVTQGVVNAPDSLSVTAVTAMTVSAPTLTLGTAASSAVTVAGTSVSVDGPLHALSDQNYIYGTGLTVGEAGTDYSVSMNQQDLSSGTIPSLYLQGALDTSGSLNHGPVSVNALPSSASDPDTRGALIVHGPTEMYGSLTLGTDSLAYSMSRPAYTVAAGQAPSTSISGAEATAAQGGDLSLTAGAGVTGGGSISIDGGTATYGTNGSVVIGSVHTADVQLGAASIPVEVQGVLTVLGSVVEVGSDGLEDLVIQRPAATTTVSDTYLLGQSGTVGGGSVYVSGGCSTSDGGTTCGTVVLQGSTVASTAGLTLVGDTTSNDDYVISHTSSTDTLVLPPTLSIVGAERDVTDEAAGDVAIIGGTSVRGVGGSVLIDGGDGLTSDGTVGVGTGDSTLGVTLSRRGATTTVQGMLTVDEEVSLEASLTTEVGLVSPALTGHAGLSLSVDCDTDLTLGVSSATVSVGSAGNAAVTLRGATVYMGDEDAGVTLTHTPAAVDTDAQDTTLLGQAGSGTGAGGALYLLGGDAGVNAPGTAGHAYVDAGVKSVSSVSGDVHIGASQADTVYLSHALGTVVVDSPTMQVASTVIGAGDLTLECATDADSVVIASTGGALLMGSASQTATILSDATLSKTLSVTGTTTLVESVTLSQATAPSSDFSIAMTTVDEDLSISLGSLLIDGVYNSRGGATTHGTVDINTVGRGDINLGGDTYSHGTLWMGEEGTTPSEVRIQAVAYTGSGSDAIPLVIQGSEAPGVAVGGSVTLIGGYGDVGGDVLIDGGEYTTTPGTVRIGGTYSTQVVVGHDTAGTETLVTSETLSHSGTGFVAGAADTAYTYSRPSTTTTPVDTSLLGMTTSDASLSGGSIYVTGGTGPMGYGDVILGSSNSLSLSASYTRTLGDVWVEGDTLILGPDVPFADCLDEADFTITRPASSCTSPKSLILQGSAAAAQAGSVVVAGGDSSADVGGDVLLVGGTGHTSDGGVKIGTYDTTSVVVGPNEYVKMEMDAADLSVSTLTIDMPTAVSIVQSGLDVEPSITVDTIQSHDNPGLESLLYLDSGSGATRRVQVGENSGNVDIGSVSGITTVYSGLSVLDPTGAALVTTSINSISLTNADVSVVSPDILSLQSNTGSGYSSIAMQGDSIALYSQGGDVSLSSAQVLADLTVDGTSHLDSTDTPQIYSTLSDLDINSPDSYTVEIGGVSGEVSLGRASQTTRVLGGLTTTESASFTADVTLLDTLSVGAIATFQDDILADHISSPDTHLDLEAAAGFEVMVGTTTGDVTMSTASGLTHIQGALTTDGVVSLGDSLTVSGGVYSNSLDAATSGDMTLGGNAVTTGVIVDNTLTVSGDVTLQDNLTVATALYVSDVINTGAQLTLSASEVQVYGPLRVTDHIKDLTLHYEDTVPEWQINSANEDIRTLAPNLYLDLDTDAGSVVVSFASPSQTVLSLTKSALSVDVDNTDLSPGTVQMGEVFLDSVEVFSASEIALKSDLTVLDAFTLESAGSIKLGVASGGNTLMSTLSNNSGTVTLEGDLYDFELDYQEVTISSDVTVTGAMTTSEVNHASAVVNLLATTTTSLSTDTLSQGAGASGITVSNDLKVTADAFEITTGVVALGFKSASLDLTGGSLKVDSILAESAGTVTIGSALSVTGALYLTDSSIVGPTDASSPKINITLTKAAAGGAGTANLYFGYDATGQIVIESTTAGTISLGSDLTLPSNVEVGGDLTTESIVAGSTTSEINVAAGGADVAVFAQTLVTMKQDVDFDGDGDFGGEVLTNDIKPHSSTDVTITANTDVVGTLSASLHTQLDTTLMVGTSVQTPSVFGSTVLGVSAGTDLTLGMGSSLVIDAGSGNTMTTTYSSGWGIDAGAPLSLTNVDNVLISQTATTNTFTIHSGASDRLSITQLLMTVDVAKADFGASDLYAESVFTDSITEYTASAGITINSNLHVDSAFSVSATDSVTVNLSAGTGNASSMLLSSNSGAVSITGAYPAEIGFNSLTIDNSVVINDTNSLTVKEIKHASDIDMKIDGTSALNLSDGSGSTVLTVAAAAEFNSDMTIAAGMVLKLESIAAVGTDIGISGDTIEITAAVLAKVTGALEVTSNATVGGTLAVDTVTSTNLSLTDTNAISITGLSLTANTDVFDIVGTTNTLYIDADGSSSTAVEFKSTARLLLQANAGDVWINSQAGAVRLQAAGADCMAVDATTTVISSTTTSMVGATVSGVLSVSNIAANSSVITFDDNISVSDASTITNASALSVSFESTALKVDNAGHTASVLTDYIGPASTTYVKISSDAKIHGDLEFTSAADTVLSSSVSLQMNSPMIKLETSGDDMYFSVPNTYEYSFSEGGVTAATLSLGSLSLPSASTAAQPSIMEVDTVRSFGDGSMGTSSMARVQFGVDYISTSNPVTSSVRLAVNTNTADPTALSDLSSYQLSMQYSYMCMSSSSFGGIAFPQTGSAAEVVGSGSGWFDATYSGTFSDIQLDQNAAFATACGSAQGVMYVDAIFGLIDTSTPSVSQLTLVVLPSS
ncbi:hypothetical protein KIPB_003344 [Kipferlia bialata]|uniref:Uncharacterized protein n=1 Tax=Kipferlia bialata TaxID=797122 RepID=A0A9K3GGL3_9EUKA|nr:hypothetical protein KIPB_003344 [Kipferlia bialata]|eukprot:g3344.t1